MKRRARGGGRVRGGLALLLGVLAITVALSGCVSNRGEVSQVDPAEPRGADAEPPVFPDGDVPDELVVDGVAHDLMSRPHDLHYWAPAATEAQCAASGIVAGIGAPRLLSLGYRPAAEGSSLNDLDLTDGEVEVLAAAFLECVDMSDAVSSIIYGNGRLSASASRCFAERLGETGHLGGIALGWIGVNRDDPFAADDALAESIMTATNICVAPDAFNWSSLKLPDGPDIIDVTALPGAAPTEANRRDSRDGDADGPDSGD